MAQSIIGTSIVEDWQDITHSLLNVVLCASEKVFNSYAAAN